MFPGFERALRSYSKGSHEHRSKGLSPQHSSLYEITSSSRRGDISNGYAALRRTGAVSSPNKSVSGMANATSALAPLHGLSYITPALVGLAARKIYPHRIKITSPENERSMQWGSSLDAVKAVLEGVGPDDVVEEVLQSVEVPL